MSTRTRILLVLIPWVSAFCPQSVSAGGFKNEPNGFRGVAWDTPRSRVQGLEEHSSIVGGKCYTRKGDNPLFLGIRTHRITWCFTGEKLTSVTLRFGTDPGRKTREDLYERLLQALKAHHGPPTKAHDKRGYWAAAINWENKSSVTISPFGNGVDVHIMEWERSWAAFQKSAGFNERAAIKYRTLWKDLKDRAKVEAAFREWMKREGEEVVSSFEIQQDGSVVIEPKAGALFVIHVHGVTPREATPEESKAKAEMERADQAGARWAELLDQLSERLKEKVPRRRRSGNPKTMCFMDCARELAVIRPVPPDIKKRMDTCRDQCVLDRAKAGVKTCREAVQLVRAHFQEHGAEMDKLLPQMGLFAMQGKVTRAVYHHLKAQRGMRKNCPEQVSEVDALVEPHLPKPPGH
jgi:hypothetical protein